MSFYMVAAAAAAAATAAAAAAVAAAAAALQPQCVVCNTKSKIAVKGLVAGQSWY